MAADEIVTAFEFYNFPTTDYWYGTLCDISIFTTTVAETQNQYGPYPLGSDCNNRATERVYGELPPNISFKQFLTTFSSAGHTGGNFIRMSLPPWTITETTTSALNTTELTAQLTTTAEPTG